MGPRLISGTMVRDLVICEEKVALDLHGDARGRDPVSPFVAMLWRDGLVHERGVLGRFDAPVDLRELGHGQREDLTAVAVAARAPVILGAVITHADMVGMPDVLLSCPTGYVAADVKAGSATEGTNHRHKTEYLAQVAHYSAILHEKGWGDGATAGIIDRAGNETFYDLRVPLGREGLTGADLHARLADRARAIAAGGVTRPALSAKCGLCTWRSACREELERRGDLTLIPGLGRAVRGSVETVAPSVAKLAEVDPARLSAVPGVGTKRLRRFAARARLLADPTAGPVSLSPLGLVDGSPEIDFDVEADPLRGIVYLHGFWHVEGEGGRFVHFFAETPDAAGERSAFAEAIDHFRKHRDSQWYHYSAYEKTAYAGLQRRHPDVCGIDEIEAIFAPERCTDLYAKVVDHTDWPLSSYGIKPIAKACGFDWEDSDPGGANSVEWYDRWVRTGDPELRERIVAYNRDDVRASARVREAMRELDATGSIAGYRRACK